jgi:putative MATE family efflux protein
LADTSINKSPCNTSADTLSDTPEGAPKIDAADRLGVEPVGRLLLRFSIPAITGMLVSALYNVVDRIFVGRGVGEAALAGISLVMPLASTTFAFAMLFGLGSANIISMRLGQGRRLEAENILSHCFFLLLATGIAMTALGLFFSDPLLALVGARAGSLSHGYAREYFRITLYGSVFMMLGFGFSHCTRAQGFPVITMSAMLLSAGLNIILDAVFIFAFKWGVAGAAWATIISQFISCIWIFSFVVSKKAVIRLKLYAFKPSLKIVMGIAAFGSSPFIMQFVWSLVMFLYNISISWYGAASLGVADGSDIALSAFSMINAISMLIHMPMFGINQGAQPILGYNYGAKKFARVLNTYSRAIIAATFICLGGFIAVQMFPHFLVRLFVPNGSAALYTFTPQALRIVFITLPFAGFQFVSANMFTVTGRPKIAIFLNLLKQCLILTPCILIFGRLWGVTGIVMAAPVSDGFAVLFTTAMVLRELKKLKRSS